MSPEFCADTAAQNSGELKILDCRLQIYFSASINTEFFKEPDRKSSI